jgi:hypothetical protein
LRNVYSRPYYDNNIPHTRMGQKYEMPIILHFYLLRLTKHTHTHTRVHCPPSPEVISCTVADVRGIPCLSLTCQLPGHLYSPWPMAIIFNPVSGRAGWGTAETCPLHKARVNQGQTTKSCIPFRGQVPKAQLASPAPFYCPSDLNALSSFSYVHIRLSWQDNSLGSC